MKLERIRQVLPNGVVTDHGFRTVIGDQPLYPGGFVNVHNDKVMGYVKKPQFVPRLGTPGYRFASSSELKIYTVSEDFQTVIKSDDIFPPTANSALLLHAYDAGTEYFVWLDNENSPYRCIIERNGVIIADVGTEIPSMPDECDARITNGAIEWVVGCRFPDEPRWYLARFENETLKESVTFDLSQYFESATTESSDRLVEQISHAEYSAVPGGASVETMQIYLARGGRTGLMQLVEYTNSQIVL